MSAPKVLVIDDDPAVRRQVEGVLRRLGCEAQAAVDGEQGLAMLREAPPDLVLLDVAMPKLDGLSVLKAASRERPEVPILMLTSQAQVKTASRAMALGARNYLTKPIDPSQLEMAVRVQLPQLGG